MTLKPLKNSLQHLQDIFWKGNPCSGVMIQKSLKIWSFQLPVTPISSNIKKVIYWTIFSYYAPAPLHLVQTKWLFGCAAKVVLCCGDKAARHFQALHIIYFFQDTNLQLVLPILRNHFKESTSIKPDFS
jgi:hypothetical protein